MIDNMFESIFSGSVLSIGVEPNCSDIIYELALLDPWAYGKEKIRGAERNLPDFFGLCPRCQKNFPEKLSKIAVDGVGGVITKNSY